MAGESPDRSKKRESSAEPTPGSAGPVPEPADTSSADTTERRDPRLAMARENAAPQGPATASRGGVDTATRALSRHDLEAARTKTGSTKTGSAGAATAGAGGTAGAEGAGAGAEGTDAGAEGTVAGGAEAAAGGAGAEAAGAEGAEAEGTGAEAVGAGGAEVEGETVEDAEAAGGGAKVVGAEAEAGSAGTASASAEVVEAEAGDSEGLRGAEVVQAEAGDSDGSRRAEVTDAGDGSAGVARAGGSEGTEGTEGTEVTQAEAVDSVDSEGSRGADVAQAETEAGDSGTRDATAADSDAGKAAAGEAGAVDGGARDSGVVDADAGNVGVAEAEAGKPEAGNAAAGKPEVGDAAEAGAGDAESRSAGAGNGRVADGERPQGAEGQGGDAAVAGDDRLKAAVAAWVASADADDTADADAKAADARDAADSAEGDAARNAEKADGAAAGAATKEPATASDSDAGTVAEAAPKADADEPAEPAASGTGEPTEPSGTDRASTPATPAKDAEREGRRPGAPARDAEPADGEGTPQDRPASGSAPADAPAASTPATPPTDGEDAPQGPPAGGDESRTGGAGGKAEADTEADTDTEAEGGAGAVDQPTAVFKAVRPAAPTPAEPQVDQPTTMLKAPTPEAPSERTSKFVALKPDIRPDRPDVSRAPQGTAPDVTAAVPQVGPERTTQQPLPPKPPLDLLAELTNTPPPPDTPVRTLVRRIKIWTPLVLLLVIIFAIVQAVRPLPTPTLALTAEESYTFEGSKVSLPWPGEGQGWMDVNGIGTMGDFGEQKPVAIGSVAKAMTAYVVLKDHPMKPGEDGKKIEVDALAEKEGGYNKDGESTLDTVKEGDILTQREAIAAIMIPSANNIARLLARWDAGSEKAFIQKMNDTAEELGMKNTTYTDASGLKETTVSTAEDQVKLGNELVKIPALTEITAMGQWIDPSGKKHYNYNYLVPYNGAIGIKTGTTTAAGGNLLFAARKEVGGETVTLVGAVLGQHKAPIIQTVNDVSKTAMLAAQDELTSAKILKKGDVVGYVDDGLGGRTPVVLTQDVTAVGWSGYQVKLSFDADDVPHTAKAGTKVGTLTVGDGTSGAVKAPVALRTDLAEPGFTDKLTRLG
ncbi:D-alanyl-D-alanine carboxypeptidase [Streptomyces sp. NPDC006385]|uniref:D-alanyl-D-alanine carboxypeptidase n=1 Tax=Streptomyces sp. NPDC006385 TaxID=3156761 RepID=UPI0033AD8F95